MASRLCSLVSLSLLCLQAVAATLPNQPFNLRPFIINLSRGVPRMVELIKDTQLPEKPEYPGIGSSKGIDLEVLKSLRENWLNKFDWEKEQAYLNRLVNYSLETQLNL